MANSVTTQIVLDGPRNVVVKVEGVLDTADLVAQTLLDPAVLGGMDFYGTQKATRLRIIKAAFSIEDALSVNLFWDATVPVRIGEFVGRDTLNYEGFGGLTNNAGAGNTGKILISTEGAAAGQFRSFLLTLECVKTQPTP